MLGLSGIGIGLTTSPALVSISVGILVASVWISKNWKTYLRNFIRNPLALGFAFLLVLHFISYFYTENIPELLKEIRIKLPLILLPVTLLNLPNLSSKEKYLVWVLFILSVSFTACLTLANYLLHYEEITANIIHSKEVPIKPKMSHIYYSMIAAFAVWASVYAYQYPVILWKRIEKKILLALGLFIAICMHIFTARTGLVALYVSSLVFAVYYIFVHKKYRLGIILLGLLVVVPVLSTFVFRGFHDRVVNTYIDLKKYQQGQNISYRSISLRLVAWKTAGHIIKKNFLFGVGIGDNEDEMKKQYQNEQVNACQECLLLNTHNQFIEFTLAFGVLGGGTLLFVVIYPLWYASYRKNLLFMLFWTICLTSMLTEAILERQIGVTFMTFFTFFILKSQPQNTNE
ncbi:MAG: O-antigen ligase family protein [Bacteroidia bacterium]|nr:O-antigen ligase family protein [Bacteroidia bacterium]